MEHIEREFKSAINEQEYHFLIKKYQLEDKIYWQQNYYFDTPNFLLKEKGNTLRIREKQNNIHLTLKIDEGDYMKEKTLILNKDDMENKIKNGFDAKIVGINQYVNNYASLKTYRARFKYLCGTIFIDKNEYYDNTDYEIEFELDEGINKEDGYVVFLSFLKENNIEFKKQISKVRRATLKAPKN